MNEDNDKNCQYCTNTKTMFKNRNIQTVYIELDGSMTIQYWFGDDDLGANFKINYCPMCGRSLEEIKESEDES